MLKKLFSLHYDDKLILEMLAADKIGLIASGIIGPLIIVSVLYNHVPINYLLLWIFLQFALMIFRLYVGAKLHYSIQLKSNKTKNYLCTYIFTTSFTAFLLGMVSWLSIVYTVPEINIFIIGTVIIALAAGSIATLGTVFIAFTGFMIFSIIPFVFALLYHGGLIFYVFSLIMIIFIIVHILSGYRLYLSHKHTIELELKFKTIYNKSSNGIGIIKNHRIIECNDTLVNMFGYESNMKEFLNTNIYKLMPLPQEEKRVSIKKMLFLLNKAQNEDITFEWHQIKKNGDTFWVDISLSSIELNGEKLLLGTWKDINEKKKSENKIKNLNTSLELKVKKAVSKNRKKDKLLIKHKSKQKEYLDVVIESNNHAIIAINKHKKILTYNKKAEEIFGFTQEEMIGSKNLLKIIPLKYKNLHTVSSELYFRTGESKGIISQTLELEGLTKEGKTIPIRISFGASKNKKLVVANIYDISNEKIQAKILQQQSRLAQMGEMISMIAHQWRQPLSAINSTSTALNLKAKLNKLDNDTVIKLTDQVLEYTQYLSTTIDDFRNFFKSNKEKEEVSYTQLIECVMRISEGSMSYENINLIQELNCKDTFHIYQNEFKQVILNLIKNAEDVLVENNVKNPYIKIHTYKEGTKLILEVSDNGGGISDDIIANIFDPYFSTKLKKDGTGLGLYMSKMIIEDHCNGTLSVFNTKDGALFKIEILKEENV